MQDWTQINRGLAYCGKNVLIPLRGMGVGGKCQLSLYSVLSQSWCDIGVTFTKKLALSPSLLAVSVSGNTADRQKVKKMKRKIIPPVLVRNIKVILVT